MGADADSLPSDSLPSDLLQVGVAGPDFSLADTHGAPVTLADLRGAPALLVFFPFAFSSVCHSEFTELNRRLADFGETRVLGISCDSVMSLRAWADHEDFAMTLLSDFWPHGQAARAYGAFDSAVGHPRRLSVLLDAGGAVAWTASSTPGKARDMAEHVAAAQSLVPGAVQSASPW